MDQFLELARTAGHCDSQGVFSIDPESARQKFRQFGLQRKHDYVCLLINALVAGRCSFLNVQADSDDLILESDFYCSQDQLEQLFSLAAGAGEPHYFKLALGLQAALAMQPSKVEMATWDGRSGARLRLELEGLSVAKLLAPPWHDTRLKSRIHVREKPSLRTAGRYMAQRLFRTATPEQEQVRERFARAVIPIALNDQAINRPANWGPCLAYVMIGEVPGRATNPRATPFPNLLPNIDPDRPIARLDHSELFAVIGLSEERIWAPQAELVVSGASFEGWNLEVASYFLVVTDQLNMDLSLNGLVEDSKYQDLRSEIDRLFGQGCRSLYSGPLREARPFQTNRGEQTFLEVEEVYRENGVLLVTSGTLPTNEARMVIKEHRLLSLLFPRQARFEPVLKPAPVAAPADPPPWPIRSANREPVWRHAEWPPKCGLIDRSGRWLCKPESLLRGARVQQNRLSYERDDLWGYTDGEGVPVIPPRFRATSGFREGRAVVSWPAGGKDQLISLDGSPVGPTYDAIVESEQGPRPARSDGLWGLIGSEGEVILPLRFERIRMLGDGRAVVDDRIVVGTNGETIAQLEVPPEIQLVTPLANGSVLARLRARAGRRWGVLGPRGQWLLEPKFKNALAVGFGKLALQRKDQKWALACLEAGMLTDFVFDFVFGPYREGRLVAKCHDDYVYLDEDGQVVLRGYQAAGPFSEGLAAVALAGSNPGRGYIDRDGATVIPGRFHSAEPFSEGRAVVTL